MLGLRTRDSFRLSIRSGKAIFYRRESHKAATQDYKRFASSSTGGCRKRLGNSDQISRGNLKVNGEEKESSKVLSLNVKPRRARAGRYRAAGLHFVCMDSVIPLYYQEPTCTYMSRV